MQNPLTLEAFADWAGKQPRDKRYNYENAHVCACAQYAESLGLNFREILSIVPRESIWRTMDNIAGDAIPHTFGNLHDKLRDTITYGYIESKRSALVTDWFIDEARVRNYLMIDEGSTISQREFESII